MLKCKNDYIVLEDEEQKRIWELYDNIQEIVKTAGASDYDEAKEEISKIKEFTKELCDIIHLWN